MWVGAGSGGWKSNLQSIVIVNLIYIIMYGTPAMKMIFGNYYCTAMVLNP